MPTINDFRERYPEFKKVDGFRIDLFLLDAQQEISQARWGRLFERGVLALAAHLLRLSLWATEGNGGANRNVASESAGELSVGYALKSIPV